MKAERVLYVGSSNAGKLRDFATAATSFAAGRLASDRASFKILPVPGLDRIAAPDEDATTFEENARTKAIYYSRHVPGELVVADDSGLEVDALNGAPGVYSARYAERAGAPATGDVDLRNNRHLIEELARVLPPSAALASRKARYQCVLAAAMDGVCVETANGSMEGLILPAPRGNGGFGYDPLFYLPAYGCTMAELDAATHLSLSHRGAALRSLLPKLASLSG